MDIDVGVRYINNIRQSKNPRQIRGVDKYWCNSELYAILDHNRILEHVCRMG